MVVASAVVGASFRSVITTVLLRGRDCPLVYAKVVTTVMNGHKGWKRSGCGLWDGEASLCVHLSRRALTAPLRPVILDHGILVVRDCTGLTPTLVSYRVFTQALTVYQRFASLGPPVAHIVPCASRVLAPARCNPFAMRHCGIAQLGWACTSGRVAALASPCQTARRRKPPLTLYGGSPRMVSSVAA